MTFPLADRIRAMLAGERILEKRMFGGICFMLNGNMMLAASPARGLMVRVGKDGYAAAMKKPGTRPMEMRGRPMEGYLYVDDTHTARDRDLKAWVDIARAYTASLPPKKQAAPKRPASARAKPAR